MSGAAAAPTLVRHTEPTPYARTVIEAAQGAAQELLTGVTPDGTRGVRLAPVVDPTLELAATLLYRASHLSYDQILDRLSPSSSDSLAALAYQGRGPHDELPREARVGYQLIFDLCIDQGALGCSP